jgi:hypothetical protein
LFFGLSTILGVLIFQIFDQSFVAHSGRRVLNNLKSRRRSATFLIKPRREEKSFLWSFNCLVNSLYFLQLKSQFGPVDEPVSLSWSLVLSVNVFSFFSFV